MSFIWGIFTTMEQFVRFCIAVQTAAIVAFGLFTLVMLIHRKIMNDKAEKLKEKFGELIVGELIALAENPSEDAVKASLPAKLSGQWTGFELRVLQISLLEHMRSVTGQERVRIEWLYRLCGAEKVDLVMCQSRLWWRRLRAVSHLTTLKSVSTAPDLFKLTTDSNDLVAGAALLALSRIEHPLNHPSKWPAFPPSLLRRRSVFCEILSNVGRSQGVDYLVRWLRIAKNDEFKSICLQVILSLKSAESVPLLCDTLTNSPNLTAALACDILSALKGIGDPLANGAAWKCFTHPHPRVRSRAADLLLETQLDREADILTLLDGDASAEVRRVAMDYRKRMGLLTGETGRAA